MSFNIFWFVNDTMDFMIASACVMKLQVLWTAEQKHRDFKSIEVSSKSLNFSLHAHRLITAMQCEEVANFNGAIRKATNKSKLRLMDITEAFGYCHDGHPRPYRSPDQNKITKRGPDGRPA